MRPFILFLTLLVLSSCGGSSAENKSVQTGGVTNFTGTWSLSRANYSTTGVNVDCKSEDLVVFQDDTKVVVGARSSVCGNYAYSASEMEYEIKGSKLIFAGREAGEIGTNYIHIRASDNQNSSYSLFFDSYDDRTTFRESASSNEGSYFIFTAVINRIETLL